MAEFGACVTSVGEFICGLLFISCFVIQEKCAVKNNFFYKVCV